MLTFIFFAVSVNTAAAETSEPVPAVVGTQMRGKTGPGTRLSPTQSVASPPWARMTATSFAASMLLPPPRPRRASGLNVRAAWTPSRTTSTGGSGTQPVKTSQVTPATVNGVSTRSTSPAFTRIGSVTIRMRFAFNRPAMSPS